MPRAYLSVDTQRVVIERAHSRCEYCQSQADYATETFAVEHIQPISQGGSNDLNNLALSCSGCANKDGAKLERIRALGVGRNKRSVSGMDACAGNGLRPYPVLRNPVCLLA